MPFINEQPVQSEVNDPLEHELVLAAYKIKFSTVLSLEVTKFDLTIGFSVVDLVEKGLVKIDYCPTGEMLADFMTKTLQGDFFLQFKDRILGKKRG